MNAFTEHRVPTAAGQLYVRDYPGSGPAFALLHGFPDNGHIFDDLIPQLTAGGRRAITIDFLGFGASDKPEGAQYSFTQQRGDVLAVLDALALEKAVLVGHDAGGPAALNLALSHPDRVASVVLMNVFYCEAPGLLVPELIELFSHKPLQALAQHFLADPQQFAWLIEFQRQLLLGDANEAGKTRYNELLGPLIDANFRQQPSAAMAFAQMTGQLKDEVAANSGRIVALRRSSVPVQLIWGRNDPYLHLSTAAFLQAQLRDASLHALDAGHWPQIDAAEDCARIMLAA
jgi:pimeloyl-ACP methyl ester carboxylesterase